MQFNPYIWQLYKNSKEGMIAIRAYASLWQQIRRGKFKLTLADWSFGDEWFDIGLTAALIHDLSGEVVQNIEEAGTLFQEVVDELTQESPAEATDNMTLSVHDLLAQVAELSVALYSCFPDYFIPYFFAGQFYLLEQICRTFEIPLPDVPAKKDFNRRVAYYAELCKGLYEFRQSCRLSPAELCAFLYSFAPNLIITETEDELPSPMKIWIVGGGVDSNGDFEFLDEATASTVSRWQGNVDTRRGDIVLVYCVAPRSYIHSIWRAKIDGFNDPLAYYYNRVWLCDPIKTKPVTYTDLRNDPLLAQNGLVRRSMQGVNGCRFTNSEYEAILQLLVHKGQDVSRLPRLDAIREIGEGMLQLQDERDVEIHLVEPLLTRLGFAETDWMRQMPLRMGRGERIYPDYAFFPVQRRGEEQANMVLETKYRLKTQRELFLAYSQAKSYALRLQAPIFVVAAVEGIWIFPSTKTGFIFENHRHKTWNELTQPDNFSDLMEIVSAKVIRKVSRTIIR